MFEDFVTGPDLSLVYCLDALRQGFQGMASVENTARPVAKGVHDALGFGTLQQHDGRSAIGLARLLEALDACLRAVLKLFADQSDVRFIVSQPANDCLRRAG